MTSRSRSTAVGAADLLSDVLATSKSGTLLLTGLVNTQVIRTAIVADLCGVVFVRGKKPGEEILSLARESKIPVLGNAAQNVRGCRPPLCGDLRENDDGRGI